MTWHKKQLNSFSAQKGETSPWTMVGIIVVIIALAGGIVFWPKYKLEYQINETNKNISVLQQSISYLLGSNNPVLKDPQNTEPGNLKTTLMKYSGKNLTPLVPPADAPASVKNHFYNKTTDSPIIVEGVSTNYSMSVITLENIPGKMCEPLVEKLYNQFDQVIPYSSSGGIGTCYNWVKDHKPAKVNVVEACKLYQDENQKIWMSFVMKNGSQGGCNLPY